MLLRISIPLLLMTSTWMVFLSGYIFAGKALEQEAGLHKSIALLDEESLNKAPPELVRVMRRVLIARAGANLSPSHIVRIINAVARCSRLNGYDPFLLLAVIETESGFRSGAVSRKGAMGLMQVRPFVARAIARELDLNPNVVARKLHDPEINLMIGSYYLAKLINRFDDLDLALEAYNRGPTRVAKYVREGRKFKMRYTRKVLRYRKNLLALADYKA